MSITRTINPLLFHRALIYRVAYNCNNCTDTYELVEGNYCNYINSKDSYYDKVMARNIVILDSEKLILSLCQELKPENIIAALPQENQNLVNKKENLICWEEVAKYAKVTKIIIRMIADEIEKHIIVKGLMNIILNYAIDLITNVEKVMKIKDINSIDYIFVGRKPEDCYHCSGKANYLCSKSEFKIINDTEKIYTFCSCSSCGKLLGEFPWNLESILSHERKCVEPFITQMLLLY